MHGFFSQSVHLEMDEGSQQIRTALLSVEPGDSVETLVEKVPQVSWYSDDDTVDAILTGGKYDIPMEQRIVLLLVMIREDAYNVTPVVAGYFKSSDCVKLYVYFYKQGVMTMKEWCGLCGIYMITEELSKNDLLGKTPDADWMVLFSRNISHMWDSYYLWSGVITKSWWTLERLDFLAYTPMSIEHWIDCYGFFPREKEYAYYLLWESILKNVWDMMPLVLRVYSPESVLDTHLRHGTCLKVLYRLEKFVENVPYSLWNVPSSEVAYQLYKVIWTISRFYEDKIARLEDVAWELYSMRLLGPGLTRPELGFLSELSRQCVFLLFKGQKLEDEMIQQRQNHYEILILLISSRRDILSVDLWPSLKTFLIN